MKKIGILLIILGIVTTIFTGISFQQEENMVEIGAIEITREKERKINWPPWAGVGGVVVGVVILLTGRKR